MAQKKDTYYNIPEAPKEFKAATVVSRMVDGLGFRYYWASYGLTEKDLAFKPSSDARTSLETVSYTHLRAHETLMNLVCRLLLEKI